MDLLGLSATNKPSCGRCAFERDRAEQRTREYGCDMRLFAGCLDGESESGLPVGSIGGNQMSSLFSRVSPTTNPAVTRSLLRGQTDARRRARSSASATLLVQTLIPTLSALASSSSPSCAAGGLSLRIEPNESELCNGSSWSQCDEQALMRKMCI